MARSPTSRAHPRTDGGLGRPARRRSSGVTLAPGAAKALAERVGAFVREGDVDRRRQSELANAELEKLALYRPDGKVTAADVEDLVSEAIPGSTWAFLDALGARREGEAAELAERLLDAGTAMPLLIAQIHRRLRELIVVRDHLDAGTRPADLVRALKLQPFRAQKLAEQAARWDAASLEAALSGLLELDLLSKGIAADGSPRSLSDDRSQLALLAWIGERVSLRGGSVDAPAIRDQSAPDHASRKQDLVGLDGEHAATLGQVEHVDQVRVDVQLLAVLAQAGREAEAQPLVSVRQPERGVEARVDEAPGALRALGAKRSHAGTLGSVSCSSSDPLVRLVAPTFLFAGLLEAQQQRRLGPQPLELVEVALGLGHHVNDYRAEVDEQPMGGARAFAPDRADALVAQALGDAVGDGAQLALGLAGADDEVVGHARQAADLEQHDVRRLLVFGQVDDAPGERERLGIGLVIGVPPSRGSARRERRRCWGKPSLIGVGSGSWSVIAYLYSRYRPM